MKRTRLLSAVLVALLSTPAAAQVTLVPRSGEQSIVVTGNRLKGQHRRGAQMSDWRVAETPHVVVFSEGDPKELARIAQNLEKLHFLLSILLNRANEPDNTLKLQVTLIGDPVEFDHLGLRDIRWQQGPYPREFPNEIYYDPREDGPVMATAHADQCFALDPGATVLTSDDLNGIDLSAQPDETPDDTTVRISSTITDVGATHCSGNPNKVSVTAESRLYSAFAQHYLLTYFPVAYPRWYLEGFGEIFATMNADQDGIIEYGMYPQHYGAVLDKFGHYPVSKVLDGTYLHDKQWMPAFSPYTAWGLVHLLLFSNEWKVPLHNYLAAIARGENPQRAAAILGDVNKLQRELNSYIGGSVDAERVTYPKGQFSAPLVHQLTQSEAAYVRGRLQLGAAVTIADSQGPAHQSELDARDRWLNVLRSTAAKYPHELADQQLLAEAECRSGNADNCLAAADRALSLSPNDPVALTWKGNALVEQAISTTSAERQSLLDQGRAAIIEANHFDTESVLPLLAYYRSYQLAGEPAPDVAIDGLAKSLDEVPSAPATRLALGGALASRSETVDAKLVLLPLADSPFNPPEKTKAEQLLATLPAKVAANDVPVP